MLTSIGHGNFVENRQIVTILRSDSAAAKRKRREAAEFGLLINATNGRVTRSLIVLQTNHIVLSALTVEAVSSRVRRPQSGKRKKLSFYG